ncbi:MAG TPA: protein-disulfide reductase DsbD [Trinickia sp.]|jgi:thiol:disulfide interchange protein DsbD|uniref:protein-disulfide reductase DsbD n=1 Tax=Trinickia sp. TaxID=2571163 RepID=UPI002BEBD2FF|nr:protein-disulfide reductase DsbD [Trinickia sp.]HTI17661.1 protein-disulfide reductase DsbD [Trinickia sp.]
MSRLVNLRGVACLARLLFVFLVASCFTAALSGVARADDFLDPSSAFRFSATEQPGEVDVRFAIADGYYLYRERFAFAVKSGNATLGAAQLPSGHVKFDPTFEKNVETYRNEVVIRIPVTAANGPFDLSVTSQGCADAGICYPPANHVYRVEGAALHAAGATGAETVAAQSDDVAAVPWYERVTNADYAQSLLQGGSFAATVGLYFLAGIVLSLLPCSYPMIPIISAIIIGEGHKVTRARGVVLSLAYVLGMALVYTGLGIAAALVGQSLGAWLQNPWVLGAFALLLTVFAMSLIAGVDIALPQRWHDRVTVASNRRSGGKLAAVAAMGALSALVVGACMTAPLFAVLAFIAHTGNAVLGGAALFSMGLGLGVPLVVVGLGAGVLLPKSGTWMDGIKVLFGVILLAAALWIVWPVLGAAAQMLLGALWLLFAAATLGLFTPLAGTPSVSVWRRLGRGLGAALAIWAATLLVGLAAGSNDPLRPLAVLTMRGAVPGESTVSKGAAVADDAGKAGSDVGDNKTNTLPFQPVRSTTSLDQALKTASRPVMLDFYANWCVSCKEMERFTFSDPRVSARLAQLQLMRADVTANDVDDQALLKRFTLFGPPGIVFFDRSGKEVERVVGYESADVFLRRLDRLNSASQP